MDEETRQRLEKIESQQAKLERNQKRIVRSLRVIEGQQAQIIQALQQLSPRNDNHSN